MADAEVTRKGHTITLGDDVVRIEEGPVRKTETATEELLHDDNSAPHYYEGKRPTTFNKPDGSPIEVQTVGRDSLGKPIKTGEPMTYLAWGGNKRPAENCFYIYAKRPIDPTVETLGDGTANPHFVPDHVRAGALLADDDTPPNRTHYTYHFHIIETVTIPINPTTEQHEEAEKAAIARGQAIYADEIAKEGANA